MFQNVKERTEEYLLQVQRDVQSTQCEIKNQEEARQKQQRFKEAQEWKQLRSKLQIEQGGRISLLQGELEQEKQKLSSLKLEIKNLQKQQAEYSRTIADQEQLLQAREDGFKKVKGNQQRSKSPSKPSVLVQDSKTGQQFLAPKNWHIIVIMSSQQPKNIWLKAIDQVLPDKHKANRLSFWLVDSLGCHEVRQEGDCPYFSIDRDQIFDLLQQKRKNGHGLCQFQYLFKQLQVTLQRDDAWNRIVYFISLEKHDKAAIEADSAMFRKCQTITQDQVSVFWQVFDDSEPACENWIKHKIFGASLYYLPETKGPLVQAFAKISAKQTLPSFKTKVLKTVQNTEQIQREEEEKTKLAQAQLSNRSEEIGSMINIEIMVCKNQMEEELEELVLKIGLKQKEATKVETIMLELQEEIQACQRAIEAIKMADVSIEVDLDKSHEAQRGFSFPHTRSSMGPIFEPTTEFSNLLEKFNQAFQIFQEEASTIVNQAMDLAEKLFNACLRLWQSMKENEDVADQIELIKSEQASLAHFLENARNSF